MALGTTLLSKPVEPIPPTGDLQQSPLDNTSYSSYGNLREVIPRIGISEKFLILDVVPLKR